MAPLLRCGPQHGGPTLVRRVRMRPTSSIAMLTAVACVAAAAPARASDKPPLAAKVAACTTGADATARAAAFTASMPAASQTKRMQMRFTLMQRLGSSPKLPFKKVAVPGWGGWSTSDPGRQGFVFTRRVEALSAPAAYRAVVTFRWLDAKGHTQRTTTRTTPICEQPDPRPDLVLASVDAAPVGKSAAYTVSVSNEGHGEADPFAVTITVDGVTSDPITLGPLAAGAQVTGSLAAPRCTAGSTITVTLDATDAVAESVEGDDVAQRPCPLA
jgi:CARDB protein